MEKMRRKKKREWTGGVRKEDEEKKKKMEEKRFVYVSKRWEIWRYVEREKDKMIRLMGWDSLQLL